MSDDERVILFVCGGIALVAWGWWYWQLFAVAKFGARFNVRLPLFFAPPLCGVLLFVVLKTLSAHDVRDDPVYLLFYLVMGAAWVGLGGTQLGFIGLSARDDVIERSNPSAAAAIAGALIGLTLCFAGANVGDGPGWWVVVFSGALSTATLFVLWSVLARAADLADTITVEGDLAAGIRSAGFFIGTGLILGRAVAGNWHSVGVTVVDFVKVGWPALLFTGCAFFLEKQLGSVSGRSGAAIAGGGWMPAIAYIALAIGAVAMSG